MIRSILLFLLTTFLTFTLAGQKVLQIEKFGKAETRKIHIGEVIFIKTDLAPDTWFEAEIEDILVEAQSLVFYDRIINIKDISALKFSKRNRIIYPTGVGLQYSAIAPIPYEIIGGLVEPPIQWKGLAIISGGSLLLGTLLKLIPPKKIKMGKKNRLRTLDLTFYSGI